MFRKAYWFLLLMLAGGTWLGACIHQQAPGALGSQEGTATLSPETNGSAPSPSTPMAQRTRSRPNASRATADSAANATPSLPEASPPVELPTPSADILHGIGMISASTLDEYRGADNRGGQYSAVTFNMAEQLVLLRGINLGEWGEWGEPRRTGYKYNWARSGATSYSMITQGQHTGVAEQIASGEVTFVFIFIGANDFNPSLSTAYAKIYSGQFSDEKVREKVNNAVADVTLATDTVLDAGAMGVTVFLFPHWNLDPRMEQLFPDDTGRQRVEDAIDAINEGIKAMAAERNVILIDPNEYVLELLSEVDENYMLDVGGELIDFSNPGNEPHHARLQDKSGHAGTVISGLMANKYLIEPLNTYFGAGIPPLTEQEILSLAGIGH